MNSEAQLKRDINIRSPVPLVPRSGATGNDIPRVASGGSEAEAAATSAAMNDGLGMGSGSGDPTASILA